MTLKERFKEIIFNYDYTPNTMTHSSKQCEKIAEDFAIGFAMAISTHCYCELGNDTRSYKELLEIYKKEKGL